MNHKSMAALLILLTVGLGCAWDGASTNLSDGDADAQERLVETVRRRMPRLKPGMSEQQAWSVLSDLHLVESDDRPMTSSGGYAVTYVLSPRHQLRLTFMPERCDGPRKLTEAVLREW
jgi:hypothetical protein